MGIDLGTTYSAAAVQAGSAGAVAEMLSLGHRASIVPSAVFITESGDVLVGDAALRRGAASPERFCREFKRRLGDSVPLIIGGSPFSAEALTARLLRWIATTVIEQRGEAPSSVTLTYPANWGAFKQERMAQAIRIAELAEVVAPGGTIATITEPEAAAISYAATERVPVGEVVAVYDLGGGTFDAAVLRKTPAGFEMLGEPEGIERLGGIDIDEAIYSYVCRTLGPMIDTLDAEGPAVGRAMARLRADCVEAKEALSSDTQVSIPVLLPNLHTEVRLTRGELETMMRPVLEDTVGALRRAIGSAELTPSEVDRVLLVGGSSRIPMVGQMVTKALGRPFFVDAHPKHAVALGAALSATAAGAPPAPAPTPIPSPAPPAPTPIPSLPTPVASPSSGVPASPPGPPSPPSGRPVAAPPGPASAAASDADGTGEMPVVRTGELPVPAEYVPESPPAVRRRRTTDDSSGSRSTWQVVGGVVLVAAIGVAAFVSLSGDDDPPGDGQGEDVTGDGTPELTLAGTTEVGEFPDGVAVDGDDLWIAATRGQAVDRLDLATGNLEETFPLDGEPLAVAVAEGSVWVTQRAADTVARLDPATGVVTATIVVPDQPAVLSFGAGSLWVGGGGGTLTRIDPTDNSATVVREGLGNVAGVAATGGVIWITVHAGNVLLAIDPTSGSDIASVPVGDRPDAVVVADSGVWVANRGDGTVSKIDPVTRDPVATVAVGAELTGIVADGDRIWVISNTDGTLVLVDGPSAEIVTQIDVGTAPLGVATSPGKVWVTLSGDDAVARVEVQ